MSVETEKRALDQNLCSPVHEITSAELLFWNSVIGMNKTSQYSQWTRALVAACISLSVHNNARAFFRMAWPVAPKGCSHLLRGYSIRWFFFPDVLWFSLRTFPCEMRKLSQKHGICKISNAFPDSNFGISTGEHTPRPPRKWMLRRSSLAPSPKNAVRGPCIKRAWGIKDVRGTFTRGPFAWRSRWLLQWLFGFTLVPEVF